MIAKGLVGHWSMNSEDTDNGMIRDRSAYDNHGTLNGGVSNGGYAPSGSAMTFDGTDDYIDIPNDLFSGKNAATTTAWVKPKSLSSDAGLIQQEDSWYFQLTSGNELLIAPHGDPGVSGGNLSTGKWHFVVFSWKGNDFYKGYVDGNLVINQSSSVGSLNNSSYEASIGWRDNQNYYLDGDISEVRLYNRVLSQSEITQLYNQRSTRAHKMQQVPVAQQDLVAHYPFASSGATDQSGNGNDGTNNGATYIDDGGVEASGAASFDGSSYIDTNYSHPIDEGGAISFWIKTTDNWAVGAHESSSGDDNRFYIWDVNGIGVGNNYYNNSIGIKDGNWHHLVGSFVDGTATLYVDNVVDHSISYNVGQNQTQNLYLGAVHDRGGGVQRRFDGDMDKVHIYNRALSAAEVKRLYQSEKGVFGGIEKGYKSSDLSFFANQWNGSSNNGEVDITGSQFTKRNGEVVDITPINNGAALQEGGSVSGVEGYIMYSEQSVFDRFSDNPPNSSNGDHVIGVRKNGETWEYDDNTSFHEFSPRPTDHLIAEVGWGVDFVNGLNIYS